MPMVLNNFPSLNNFCCLSLTSTIYRAHSRKVNFAQDSPLFVGPFAKRGTVIITKVARTVVPGILVCFAECVERRSLRF